jgi:3-oxoacyl-[acyl-carrier protein] reductase
MDSELAGKGIVVTGGGGGIGQSVVRAFAAEGARVAVHYRTSKQAAEVLASEVGGVAIGADLRVEAEADRLIPRALKALGRVDVVVANAGVWPSADQPIWELSLERWRETLDANLTVTFLTARGFFRHAAATGRGSMVMIASTAGVFGEAGHADYAASKGAILSGLLLSAKNEAARLGGTVRVNVVAPGWTVTPMTTEARRDPNLEARVTSTMALKKLGTPEDVAAQVVILASDRLSGHVTGQVVVVAGGMEGRLIP